MSRQIVQNGGILHGCDECGATATTRWRSTRTGEVVAAACGGHRALVKARLDYVGEPVARRARGRRAARRS